jgi:hypothetical protein
LKKPKESKKEEKLVALIMLLNTCLVDACQIINDLRKSNTPMAYMVNNLGVIFSTLEYSSKVLGLVPTQMRRSKTWAFDPEDE